MTHIHLKKKPVGLLDWSLKSEQFSETRSVRDDVSAPNAHLAALFFSHVTSKEDHLPGPDISVIVNTVLSQSLQRSVL